MVDIIDKIASKLTLDDIEDIINDPSMFLRYDIRDEEGRIIEPKAWMPKEMFLTFEYLLTFMDEQEAYDRVVRNSQIEFALKYYGSKYAIHVYEHINPKLLKILSP